MPTTPNSLLCASLLLSLCACSKPGAGTDGSRAHDLTRRIVEIGPRTPGSPGIRKVADLIASELKAISPSLELQRQRFRREDVQKDVDFENLWVEIPGTEHKPDGPILAVAAHYDSKITHHGEQDFRFVGALDAAASCAVLVELARHLTQDVRLPCDVWLVFFDGEESYDWNWNDSKALVGSRHFAATMNADKQRFPSGLASRMKALILLDLLGDLEFKVDREKESNPRLIEIFRSAAEQLGVQDRVFREETQVTGDDHIPFKGLGVRVIDLIDFKWRVPGEHNAGAPPYAKTFFPFWHTKDDDMPRVSADSLRTVGDLLLLSLPVIAKEFAK
ncbi:MAG: M28 family peptidase [Planctomycetota bacterium]